MDIYSDEFFLTKEEIHNLLTECDDEGNDNDFIFQYYDMVKRLYSMSFSIDDLYYEAMNNISCKCDSNELKYTVKNAMRIMGYLKKKGNNIYNKKTSDTIINRIKKYL